MSAPRVEYSDTAAVPVGDGWFNPFQSHSYAARVEYPDGPVIVALPVRAARWPAEDWTQRVLDFTNGLIERGEMPPERIVAMGDDVEPKA